MEFLRGGEAATPPFTNLAPLDVSSMERLAQNALHAGQLAQMALAGEHLTPSCVTSLIPSPKGDPTPCATAGCRATRRRRLGGGSTGATSRHTSSPPFRR